MLRGLLMPPPDELEQDFLEALHARAVAPHPRADRISAVAAATGVGRFGARTSPTSIARRRSATNGRRYREGCGEAHQISAPIDPLEEAYSWADRLATHFAQTYRSGHIFNFLLGGVAVCLGLSAFMAPHLKFEFAAVEVVITFAIILNAAIGSRQQWHRRWLDYRQLAERLRPMRSLKLLGIAAPDPPGTETNPVPKRWIDWYASGDLARDGLSDRVRSTGPARRGWRRRSPIMKLRRRSAITSATSHQIELLDHRLGQIGMVLFAATLIVSVATIVGLGDRCRFRQRATATGSRSISAGFPALGTAVFGIRFQGDFGGDALRSLATAEHAAADRQRTAQGRRACRARPTLPNNRRGSCWPTSTNGGWSTSSAICRSASRPFPIASASRRGWSGRK